MPQYDWAKMTTREVQASRKVEEGLYGAIGTSDCHRVGIMGGCGLDCWVYKDGRCPSPEEFQEDAALRAKGVDV